MTELEDALLCTIRFCNKVQGRSLLAEIHHPQPTVTQRPGVPEPVKHWACWVLITLDGVQQDRTIYGGSWLSAFLLAVEFVRITIPSGEERQWVDEEGVEVWCILPRPVPFGWGYPLYEKIARISDEIEGEYVADVQRRRLVWEERRRGKDGEVDQ